MTKLNRYLATGMMALGLGTICFSTSAFSQPAEKTDTDCPAYMERGPEQGPPKHWKAEYHRHRAALHDQLGLNAEQEKAWLAYIAIADKNRDLRKPIPRADLEKMTAPERMQTMIDRMKTNESELAKQLVVLKAFYAQLTPEQQQIFDQETMKHPRFHRGGPTK